MRHGWLVTQKILAPSFSFPLTHSLTFFLSHKQVIMKRGEEQKKTKRKREKAKGKKLSFGKIRKKKGGGGKEIKQVRKWRERK